MALISDIIPLTISIQDAAPSIPNFGTILLAGVDPGIDSAAVYTFETTPAGLAAYDAAGGTANSPLRNMLAIAAAQTPKVPNVKIYSIPTGPTNQYTVEVLNAVVGREYAITVNGTVCAYTAGTGDTADNVAAALELLIEAVDGVVSAAVAAVITIDPDPPATDVALSAFDPSNLEVQDLASDANYDTVLAAAAALDPDFYGVCIDSGGATNIGDTAGWVESNRKLFAARSADDDILTSGGGVAATLKTANYHRTGLFYSNDGDSHLSVAIMAQEFAKNPGASWWGMKSLAGVTFDRLSATHIGNLKAQNANYYTQTLGVAHTMHGIAASGRGLQITRDVDWLQARIEQRVLAKLLNTDKIVFDEKGISTMKGEVNATLQEAAAKRVILPGFTVTAPALGEIAAVDVTAGHLPNVTFAAQLAYPIKKITVAGSLV